MRRRVRAGVARQGSPGARPPVSGVAGDRRAAAACGQADRVLPGCTHLIPAHSPSCPPRPPRSYLYVRMLCNPQLYGVPIDALDTDPLMQVGVVVGLEGWCGGVCVCVCVCGRDGGGLGGFVCGGVGGAAGWLPTRARACSPPRLATCRSGAWTWPTPPPSCWTATTWSSTTAARATCRPQTWAGGCGRGAGGRHSAGGQGFGPGGGPARCQVWPGRPRDGCPVLRLPPVRCLLPAAGAGALLTARLLPPPVYRPGVPQDCLAVLRVVPHHLLLQRPPQAHHGRDRAAAPVCAGR